MASALRLFVISPDRVLMDEEVSSVRAPGANGFFGVLPGHAPLIAGIGPGEFTVRDASGKATAFFVSEGVLEVRGNLVRVIVDSGEAVTEIDLNRARDAEKRARERLSLASKVEELDLPRAEYALRRALERLRIAHKYRP